MWFTFRGHAAPLKVVRKKIGAALSGNGPCEPGGLTTFGAEEVWPSPFDLIVSQQHEVLRPKLEPVE
jgi:hypothetical protein